MLGAAIFRLDGSFLANFGRDDSGWLADYIDIYSLGINEYLQHDIDRWLDCSQFLVTSLHPVLIQILRERCHRLRYQTAYGKSIS